MSITTEELRARLNLGAVAIIGAGLSLSARYPDTKNLTALVWDAIDSDPSARAALADLLEVENAPAKGLIGDNWDRLNQAWLCIAGSSAARRRFQHAFVALDSRRADQPSPPHEALARLVHEGTVELVVSFNWDSALENAYRRLYGTTLPVGVLHKDHGDVAHPDQPWVLPHEDGTVSKAVLAAVQELVDQHPRTLLIVGYAGSDIAVVDQLIAPLDERWRVTRVSPTTTGVDDVTGTAADVLSAIARPTEEKEAASAWGAVTFANQRGIESALAGHRLGPRDIAACPRLPAVELVAESLLRGHAVVLNGESGSGKSITAYQVASDLAARGYEVLRLRDSKRQLGLGVWLSALSAFPHRKLLFVDDAQDISADSVRELAETATADQLVLVAGVDHIAGGVVTHTVVGAAAVGLLERFLLDNRDDMLPKVQALDDRVGNSVMDERLELRVELAARQHNAWLFFYSLTGGWRRTGRILQEVRDRDRADILACALAVAQIAGVDSGVTVDELVLYAEALERDRAWVEVGLTILKSNQLAFEQDGVWRCPHLRSAHAILNWMLHPPVWASSPSRPPVKVGPIASANTNAPEDVEDKQPSAAQKASRRVPSLPKAVIDEDRTNTAILLDVALNESSTSMRGIAWLLGRNISTEARWTLQEHGIRTPERDRALAERALSTPPGPDVAMAAQLLEQLAGPDAPEVIAAIWEHLDALVNWVREVTPQNGWAVGSLVNILINDDRDRIAAAISTTDPSRLPGLYEAGGWPHIYSITQAIDRISQAGGDDFLIAVGEAFDEVTLSRMLDHVPDLNSANQLLSVFPYTNPDLGIRLFETHASRLAQRFSIRPIESYGEMFDTFVFLLGFGRGFMRHKNPNSQQKRALRKFLRALDTKRLVRELARPQNDGRWHNFGEFLSTYAEAEPVGWAKVAEAVDLDELERTLVAQLPNPSHHLLYVLMLLVETRPEPVRVLLDQHADGLKTLDPLLTFIHPELVLKLLKRGLALNLGLENQNYGYAAALLSVIGSLNSETAREVAEANVAAFVEGLKSNLTTPFVDLRKWVTVCDQLAPDLTENTLAELHSGVIAGWANALRKRNTKIEIGPLVVRAARLEGCPAALEASALMVQFPSLHAL